MAHNSTRVYLVANLKYKIMLKEIQKKVDELRIKVYAGQSNELTERALYDIEQMLFKAMDLQLNKPDVIGRSEQLPCDHLWKSRFNEKRGSYVICSKCSEEW